MQNHAQTSPRHVFQPDVLDEIGLDDEEFAAMFGVPSVSAEAAVDEVIGFAVRTLTIRPTGRVTLTPPSG